MRLLDLSLVDFRLVKRGKTSCLFDRRVLEEPRQLMSPRQMQLAKDPRQMGFDRGFGDTGRPAISLLLAPSITRAATCRLRGQTVKRDFRLQSESNPTVWGDKFVN